MHRIPATFRAAAAPNLLIALACAALLASGCSGDAQQKTGANKLIPAVEAVKAHHGSLPLTQRLSGLVEAHGQVDIHPEISAPVTETLVTDGALVEKGQPLVLLRATEYEKRLTQAQANLRIMQAQLARAQAQHREAKANYARAQSLSTESLASEADLESALAAAESAAAEVDLAEARVDQARSQAEEAQDNLDQCVVRSPIAGSVGNRNAEPGLLATPSTRLLTVGQLDSVRVQVILTDRMLADVEEGQRTEILLATGALEAPLARISPFLHPVSHTTEAEIDLPNPDHRLKPGMFVSVDVFTGESDEATLVPLSAVYEHPVLAQTGVYVATEPVAATPGPETQGDDTYLTPPVAFRFIPVTVIAEGRMEAAVTNVEPGAWVVSLGQNLLMSEDATARVRPVNWQHIRRLQSLQREDLMRELNENRRANQAAQDEAASGATR